MEKDEIIKIIENLDLDEILNDFQSILFEIERFYNIEIHLSLNDFESIQNQFDFHKKWNLESFESIEIENRFIELNEL